MAINIIVNFWAMPSLFFVYFRLIEPIMENEKDRLKRDSNRIITVEGKAR